MTTPILRVLTFVAILAAVGCGDSEPKLGPTATVTGKVMLSGKPLPGGRVSFQSATASNRIGSGDIKADGSYEAIGVPQGECKISVDNNFLKPKLNPTSADTPPDPSLKYVPLNAKYANPETSGLTTTVTGDKHTHDVELK